jgi:hypothetical protein
LGRFLADDDRTEICRLVHFPGLVRFIPKNTSTTTSDDEPLIGEPCDPSQDVGLASYNAEAIHVETFTGTSVLNPGERTGEKVQVERILSPLSEREVGTIRCIGLNVGRIRIPGGGGRSVRAIIFWN